MDRHVLDTSYLSTPFQDGNGIEGRSTSYTLPPRTPLQGLGSGSLLGSEPGLGSRGRDDGYPSDLSDTYMYPSHGIEKGFGQGLGPGFKNGYHEGFDCGNGRTCSNIGDYNTTTTTATGTSFHSFTTSDGKHASKTKTNTKTTDVHGKKTKAAKKKLEKKQSKIDDAYSKPTSSTPSPSQPSGSPLSPPTSSFRPRPHRTIRVGFASRYFESGDTFILPSPLTPLTLPPSLHHPFPLPPSLYPLPSVPIYDPYVTILCDPSII